MLAMFKNVDLPTDERALGLLERVNTLWDENSWLAGKNHKVWHRRVSHDTIKKIVEVATHSPDALEEKLDNEVCLDEIISWILDREDNADTY